MTEAESVIAVFECAQAVKKHIGVNQAVGLFLGAAIGEYVLEGKTKEEFLTMVGNTWDEFVKNRG